MEPADSIQRIGFRRWYERQLIRGHVWFVAGFLGMFAVAAFVEQLRLGDPLLLQLAVTAGIVAAGSLGGYGLLRYLTIMTTTLRIGEHATCRACGTYGRFSMVSPSRAHCRKCANEWLLID